MNMNVVIFAGVVLLAVVLCLAWVLPPILRKPREHESERRALNIAVYRDQLKEIESERDRGALSSEQFEQARTELEDRLAEDAVQASADYTVTDRGGRRIGWIVAGLLPLCAVSLYLWKGAPVVLLTPALAAPVAEKGPHGGVDMTVNMAKLEAELAELKATAEAKPKDGAAWFKWGMANLALERYEVAKAALQKATELAPKEAVTWAHYAEALALSGNRSLEGEPIRILRKALEINPLEPKALELAGIHAYQQENWAQAAYYWKSLIKQMSPEEKQSGYGKNIAEAERDARGKAEAGLLEASGGQMKPKKAQGPKVGPGLSGRVDLAAALKNKAKPDDVIFLFASVGEKGPPLAVMKAKASALPLEFSLDDSMAMSPEMSLSKVSEVTLVARISKSGQPKPSAGDLVGKLENVKVGAKGLRLVIDNIQP